MNALAIPGAGVSAPSAMNAPVELAPDLEAARRFLALLDPKAQNFTFQTFDDDKTRQNKNLAHIRHGSLDKHGSELIRANRSGCGIFVAVNQTDGKGRETPNITKVRAFFVDLDGAPLEPVMQAPLPLHILVESGGAGRWHAYWLVRDCPLDQFRAVQKALIQRFGSDPCIHDLPRVMRLPGYYHRKEDPRMVRLVEGGVAPPYTFAAFVDAFGIALDYIEGECVRVPTPMQVIPAPATGGADDLALIRAKKLALEAALRTHQAQYVGRHAEIYKAGQYMRRDGIPFTEETVRAFLETFETNMRPTDTSGKVCGLDWENETKALLAPPSEPHWPGTHHADRIDVSGLVVGGVGAIAPEKGQGAESKANTAIKPFPLEEDEAADLVAWVWHNGRKLPRRNDWPRSVLTGNYTAPFLGLAAGCQPGQFLAAVEKYLPKRAAQVEKQNAERLAKGLAPEPDIPLEVIRVKAKDFQLRLEALAVLDDRGRELLRKLDQDGKGPRVFRLLDYEDLAALPPHRWRIKGVLPAMGLAAIWGPPGSGKTFLSLDLAGAIATGRPEWFGARVKASPVVYAALEGESGIQTRMSAYREHYGDVGLEHMRFLVEAFSLLSEDDRPALVEAIRAVGFERPVVILDTLNRAAPAADENASADMGVIVAAAKEIQAELSGLVLLVHHSGKNAANGLRGHSSLLAALDAAIEVKREGEARSWRLAKAKDGSDGTEHPFTLKLVELGEDEDGDPVTSCVVTTENAEPIVPKAKPLAGDTRKALELLVELIHAHGVAPPLGFFPSEIVPQPDRYIASDLWRERFYDAKPTVKQEARKKSFQRATKVLEEELRAFAGWREYVWTTPETAMEEALEVIRAKLLILSMGGKS